MTRPLGHVRAADLHRAVLAGFGQARGRGITARAVADRLATEEAAIGAALDSLAGLGMLGAMRLSAGTIYTRRELPGLGSARDRRPDTGISRRELWAALHLLAQPRGVTLGTLASALDAPAGRADRTLLALRLALLAGQGLLTLDAGRWLVTGQGWAWSSRVLAETPRAAELWLAIVAVITPALRAEDARVDETAIAGRLGVRGHRLEPAVEEAIDRGLLARTDRGLVLTAAGAAQCVRTAAGLVSVRAAG